jgi:hypothetical protein
MNKKRIQTIERDGILYRSCNDCGAEIAYVVGVSQCKACLRIRKRISREKGSKRVKRRLDFVGRDLYETIDNPELIEAMETGNIKKFMELTEDR